ncbi:MAG TPA: V-type ATP synthase subunit F [Gemmatimonadales bacterium]|nr:V-type ATP synthase subunit F [Gemmatimonadales bacterium]
MSLAVRLVARGPESAGFALAGIRAVAAEPAEGGGEEVRAVLQRPDSGVVLVEDALFDRLDDDLRRRLGRHPLPIVVPFPGPSWAPPGEGVDEYILDLLRQVIGYRVRLK